MPIVVQNVQKVTGSTATLTITFTVSTSANRLLCVGVSIRNSGSQTVSQVTWLLDGAEIAQNFTSVGGVSNSTFVRSEIWALVAPDSGSGTITITLSAAANAVAGAIEFSGATQAIPTSTATATGESTAPSVTISSNTGEVILDTLAARAGPTATVGSGQTEQWNDATGILLTDVRGAGSTEDGAASVTMDWTLATSRQWSIIAIGVPVAQGNFGLALLGVGR